MSGSREFASIALARSYIETVQNRIGAFSAEEQVDTLKRIEGAYQEFPELELDCPFREWPQACQAAGTARPHREVIPLLIYCMALDPSASSIALLLERIALSEHWRLLPRIIRVLPPRELPWRFIEPIVGRLREGGRPEVIASLVSELWDCQNFAEGASPGDLETVLSYVLGDQNLLGTDPASVVQTMRSARSRLPEISQEWSDGTSREELLGLAERLRLERSGARSNPRFRVLSVSGGVSFTEFLRQWPAEIELSTETDDAGFVAEVYRVILLRSPEIDELDRDLDLLRKGAISRRQLLEKLLASGEFQALERRLRLVWEGEVIVGPGTSIDDREMPAVIWPSGLTPVTPSDAAATGHRPPPDRSKADGSRTTSCPSPEALLQRSLVEPPGRLSRSPQSAGEQVDEKGDSMSVTRQQRLDRFNSDIYGQVEGWLGDRMWQIIDVIGSILDATQVHGHVAEFGVHHGLFLLLLNAIRDAGEDCFAIDVFDEQRFNIDNSGRGSLGAFLSCIESLMPSERRFFRVVQRDTTSFSFGEIRELFGEKGVKFFSIDAGHTALHTFNDLQLVQEVLVPGGVVALDDYMSVHWPGVTEGFYRFIDRENRRLKPFAYFQNKLFLTTISEHASWLQQFRTAIETRHRDEVRARRWKEVEIAGSNCLSFA